MSSQDGTDVWVFSLEPERVLYHV